MQTYLVTSSQYLGLGSFNSVAMMTTSPSPLEALTNFLRKCAGVAASSPLYTTQASPAGRRCFNTDTVRGAIKDGVTTTYEVEDFLVLATSPNSQFLVLGGESRGLQAPLEIQIRENPLDMPIDITRNCWANIR